MKKLISLILFVSIISITSCKYEDGPKLSLRSKQHRAVETWHLNQVIEDGTDKTEKYKSAWVNYQVTLKDNMTYELKFYQSYNSTDYKETGKWAFSSDKRYINFTPDGATNLFKWEILRLKEKEIWVMESNSWRVLELHLN